MQKGVGHSLRQRNPCFVLGPGRVMCRVGKARRTAPLPKGAPLIPHNLVLTYIGCRSKSGLDGIYSSLVLLFLIDCCISTVDTALFLMPIECKGDCSTLYHV